MLLEPDMASLARRTAEVASGETACKAVLLRETLVPGQRLRITAPPALVQLFVRREPMPIVILGQHGQQQATRGVEATMEGPPVYRPVVPGIHPEGTADIVIAAHRVCDLLDGAEVVADGAIGVSRPARVRWVELDSTDATHPPAVIARSEALKARVDAWLMLVRRAGREMTPTHLDDVMADLGPMPDGATAPNARCLWVCGLINPLPPLGVSSRNKFACLGDSVAPEVRPSVLEAASVDARLSCVENALAESTRRLNKMIDRGA